MATYPAEDRSYGGYPSHSRPSGSSHGPYGQGPSPERLHSSSGYTKGELMPPQSPYQSHEQGPPGSSHGHSSYPPQPPITPVSGSNYPPQPPSGGYYGLSTPTTDQQQMPSPPLSSGGRPESQNFTPDGVPIVPVGVSGGKMFRCRGYGECDKVFTRSEHLARHVRKHTGERPFPCHCGKAFSRLDNLRQHSATVHADQAALNEAMLNSLAQVHSALSQKANKEQRRRGEIVEVPKNAVERPRHNEQYRSKSQQGQQHPGGGSPYGSPYPYHEHQFTVPPPPQGRPRTSGNYDHSAYDGPAPLSHGDEPGPSRRPSSSGYNTYPPMYYDQSGTRPPTGGSVPPSEMSHLPYPYRPMSSNGRELPIPAHYAESEPPSSAHGPPQSPMYPPNIHSAPPPAWSSSPPPPHSGYNSQSGQYPPPEGYAYPPASEHSYGPPPPATNGNYSYPPAPPQSYYPTQGYSSVAPPPASGSYPPPPPPFGAGPPPPAPGQPPQSPYSYHAPSESYYTHSQIDSRKRRSDDLDHLPRKAPRPSAESVPSLSEFPGPRPIAQEPLWLPPSTERRSSLAISALLGSPQQVPRSRPTTADVPSQPSYQATSAGFAYSTADSSGGSHSMPATPAINGDRKPEIKGEGGYSGMGNMGGVGENMEQKAKALLSQGR